MSNLADNDHSNCNSRCSRPMTAPGSSISVPGYYHSSAYGMFSPATYMGAGFPQSFPRNFSMNDAATAAAAAGYPHHPPGSSGGPPGSSSGLPPGSANAATAAASAALARDRLYGTTTANGQYSAGLPDEPGSTTHSRIPVASSSSASLDNIFAHQPPPLSSGGGPVPPPSFGAQHPHHHQGYPPTSGYRPPPVDYSNRRTLEDLDESRYSRPGTSDTARPDTAYSTFSTNSGYSAAAALYQHLTHPSLYHTAHSMNGLDKSHPHHLHHSSSHHHHQHPHTYNFIPLPSQPKKRPRRRFEEIERLYNCNYPGCNKAYGTLNHLNAHVSMQKHGPKRLPAGESLPSFRFPCCRFVSAQKLTPSSNF